jgi:hypothetical protein
MSSLNAANYFEKIFRKLQTLFKSDLRTSPYAVYGMEASKKKTLPAIVIFPGSKNWISQSNQRDVRRTSLPKTVHYGFSIWVYNMLHDHQDAYYNTTNDDTVGITQMLQNVEAVLKDNKTATDPDDSSIRLWHNIRFNLGELNNRPGKLMFGNIFVDFYRTETE